MKATSDIRSYWWIFIIWPMMAVTLALRSGRLTPNLTWAFIVFYGLTFVVSIDNSDSDVTRYLKVFTDMHDAQMTLPQFVRTLYLPTEKGSTDIVQPLITYVVSLFSGNHALLLAAFAIVFGFFYSRNVWLILNALEGKLKVLTIFFFVVFLLVVPFWNINGFRFWTAAHIFFYGTFNFIVLGNKRGLLFVILSPLMHFSFLLLGAILLVYLVIGRRTWGFFIFFIASIFYNNFEIQYFNELGQSYLPAVFVERADSYTSEKAVERFQNRDTSNKNWYALFYKKGLFWAISFMMVIIFIRYHDFIRGIKSLKGLFAFTFLLFGIANLLAVVPSGVRFAVIAAMFASASVVIVVHYKWHDILFRRLALATTPLLLLFVIVSVREGFNSIGVNTLFTNAFVAAFAENKVAIIDIIKWRF